MTTKGIIAGLIMTTVSLAANAQGYMDQAAVAPLIESQGNGPVQKVGWHRYNIGKSGKTSKIMLAKLQAHLDSLPGERTDQRMAAVELANRVAKKYMMQKGTLLVPNSFPYDFRAYAPYPVQYAGASPLPKLFIIDKYTQTFAAYEHGQLVRWGLACSGKEDDLTPGGRYSFNWKDEFRESTAAPEGEVWELKWVFNFYAKAGIHVHQYALPLANPSSHGCVRLSESDALWNYNWADGWKMQGGKQVASGTPVIVINHNPVSLAAHWTGNGQSLVRLPNDPMDVPLGPGSVESVARNN
jgi:lipoprotein-anchoring transpeptidase ErfK/SrfK